MIAVLDKALIQGGHEVYNIDDNDPRGLMEMISTLEAAFVVEAIKIMRPMQPGDVIATCTNIDKLKALFWLSAQGQAR